MFVSYGLQKSKNSSQKNQSTMQPWLVWHKKPAQDSYRYFVRVRADPVIVEFCIQCHFHTTLHTVSTKDKQKIVSWIYY